MDLQTSYLGYFAAVLTTSAFIPQVFMVWRQRGAPGISTGMYLIFITGVALWTCYGLALSDWPIILANGVTLVLASAILGMKWYFGRTQA